MTWPCSECDYEGNLGDHFAELHTRALRAKQQLAEARAALRNLVYQSAWFESIAEKGSDVQKAFAQARRVLASGEGK